MFLLTHDSLYELTGATIRIGKFGEERSKSVFLKRDVSLTHLHEACSEKEAKAIVAEIARQINACLRCGKVIDLSEVVAKVRGGQEAKQEIAT